jgi:hypothetical protein
MRFLLNAGVALAAGAVLVASLTRVDASTGPIPLNCNRACLENLIDQYLTAVVAHDPKKLPLSADVKYMENYQVLLIEEGKIRRVEMVGPSVPFHMTSPWPEGLSGQ